MKHNYIFHRRISIIILSISLFISGIYAQFTPGEGGNLPVFPAFSLPEGKVGGLLLAYSHRHHSIFAEGGTYAVVDMHFPTPASIGAESYTVQISDDNGGTWTNYQHYGEDLVLTGDNFSLSPDASYTFRLRVNGGSKDGFTSNEVYAQLSHINTRFAGWGLDEGMFLTGIMAPNIGRGLEANFTVKKLSDDSEVEGHLNYQWFRVNPLTYEMAPIENANTLNYVTTIADAGYKLALRASGDNTEVGGVAQILSSQDNLVSNNAYTSNVDQTGFNLYLFKQPATLADDDLELTDAAYNPVSITNVQTLSNNASYRISATLDPSKAPYQLMSKSACWRIVSEMEGMHMSMPGVYVDFSTGLKKSTNKTTFILKYNNLSFRSTTTISKIRISDISGRLVFESFPLIESGNINIPTLTSGTYLIQYQTNENHNIQKVILE
ncbi:MAG: T9SS type A sorting domain-containing protein [Paludibacteraceae bacterium]|nr:T9SS type A sorting domain-containing protein [Paludibacteraceae bacterium]